MKFKNLFLENMQSHLQIMHHFKLVHQDVKLENIGWSTLREMFVFLDFGFSGFIQQAAGELSKTLYIGTFSYSSPEMRKLYFLKARGWVDLYYNDLYGVLRSSRIFEKEPLQFT